MGRDAPGSPSPGRGRPRRGPLISLSWGLALLGTFPVAWVAGPWILKGYLVVCPFLAITGRPCVFCGLTRAFALAVRGEWSRAAAFHPLWWVAALLVGGLGLSFLLEAATGRPLPRVGRIGGWLILGTIILGSAVRAIWPGR